MNIYNDCDSEVVLYCPYDIQNGIKLDNDNYYCNFDLIARSHYLSIDEYNQIVKKYLENSGEIMAKLPNGEKIYFTAHDILEKGEWIYPDSLEYYICRNKVMYPPAKPGGEKH